MLVVDKESIRLKTSRFGGLMGVFRFPLSSSSNPTRRSVAEIEIDVRGPFLKCIPSLYQAIIPWALPHRPTAHWIRSDPNGSVVEVNFGSARSSSLRKKMEEELPKFATNCGNPLIVIDVRIRFHDQTSARQFSFRTRASFLIKSLRSNGTTGAGAVGTEAHKRYPPRGSNSFVNLCSIVRWFLGPAMWLYICFTIFVDHSNLPLDLEYWPILIDTLSEAFALGTVYRQILDTEIGSDSESSLLLHVQEIVGRTDAVSRKAMLDIPETLKELDEHVGIVARVLGFFTFVNCVWLLAIFGIAITAFPFVEIISRPFRRLIADMLKVMWKRFVRLLKFVWNRIVRPIFVACHNYGVFELATWALAILLLGNATVSTNEGGAMTTFGAEYFVALTSLAVSMIAFVYGTYLFGGHFVSKMGKDAQVVCSCLAISILTIPICLHLRSVLLGYVIVCAFYSSIGFSVLCFGLCYMVGFTSESAMYRTIVTSTIALVVLFSLRALRVGHRNSAWSAITTPASVMASLTLFLALLIVSSMYYPTKKHYVTRNVLFLTLGGLVLFASHVLQISGISNPTSVFFVLWFLEKWVELHAELRLNMILFVFPFSVFLYYVSLWLHRHPDFVVSLLSFDVVAP